MVFFPHLSPKMEYSGDITILTCTGSRHTGAPNTLISDLDRNTDGLGGGHLLLDFTHIESVCGHELGMLIQLHKRIGAAGGRLTLFNLQANVYEVFAITNLHRLLEICRERVLHR